MNSPNQCYFELTQRCNLGCLHCFANGSPEQTAQMTLAQVKDLYRQIGDFGIIWVNLSGGEPLLHPDFFAIMAHAARQPYQTSVLTNGTLWTEEAVQRLMAADPDRNLHMQVSLDGPSYEAIRKQRPMTREEYQRLLWTVRRLQEAGFDVTALHVVSSLTVGHSLETIRHALFDLGISTVQAVPLFPAGRAVNYLEELDRFWDQWSALIVEITRLKQAVAWGEKSHRFNVGFFTLYELVMPLDDAGLHDAIRDVWGLDLSSKEAFMRQTRRDIYCEGGRSELAISAALELFPCVASLRTAFKAGDLTAQPLREVWTNSEMLRWFRTGIHAAIAHEPCRGCEYKEVCGGGCRISALELTGDPTRPDPRCPRVRAYRGGEVAHA